MRLSPPHVVLALAALLALPAAAADQKEQAAPEKAGAAPAMKIHVDPATGALVKAPPAAAKEARAAVAAEPLPALKVQRVQAKAGGKMVKLDDRFMMDVTAKAGPDGTVSQSCEVEHAKGARNER